MDGELMDIKCPFCNHDNLQGADRCELCLHSLMQRDLPRPRKDDGIQRALMQTPISELLTGEDLLVADTDDTLEKIIKIFQRDKKDCVLVYKKKHLVGILSTRDLLLKVAGKHPDLSKVKVGQVMTGNPEFVHEQDPIAFVVNKMATGGFRHLPVIRQDGTPFSIISIRDVLSYLALANRG